MLSFVTLKLSASICLLIGTVVQSDCCQETSGFETAGSTACLACGELPSCSICTADCHSCPLPECGVCGQNQCWDCSDEEGIDVESLTPEAQSKKLYEASMARIVMMVPEAAGVSLLDRKMSTLGTKRSFLVSVNDQSKEYKYEVKVDLVMNGKKYFKKLKIQDLRAGMILNIAVEAPEVPEGEQVQIVIDAIPVEKGGKPVEKKEDDSDAGKTASLDIPVIVH